MEVDVTVDGEDVVEESETGLQVMMLRRKFSSGLWQLVLKIGVNTVRFKW